MSTKPRPILTPEFRLSFCNLFEAKPDMNGVVRFSMEMLFPKDRGGSQFKEMQALYNEVLANANWSGGGPVPRAFKEAIIDGNSKKQEGRHGMFMLKGNSGQEFPPRLLLPNKAVARPKDIYEGCWCRAIISAYTYEARKDAKGAIISRGAAFNVLTVQKIRDDDPFATFITDSEQDELLDAAPIEDVNGADDDLSDIL